MTNRISELIADDIAGYKRAKSELVKLIDDYQALVQAWALFKFHAEALSQAFSMAICQLEDALKQNMPSQELSQISLTAMMSVFEHFQVLVGRIEYNRGTLIHLLHNATLRQEKDFTAPDLIADYNKFVDFQSRLADVYLTYGNPDATHVARWKSYTHYDAYQVNFKV